MAFLSHRIVSINLDNNNQVTEKLNKWWSNGWNLPMFFVQVVGYPSGPYTIFYNERLDEHI